MFRKKIILILIAIILVFFSCVSSVPGGKEPAENSVTEQERSITNYKEVGNRRRVLVSENGALQVINNQLSNSRGEPVWLRGMSTHGLQWYPNSLNKESARILAEEWRADVVRLSMYINEGPGAYKRKQDYYKETLLPEKINLLLEQDMYIIMDWHMLSPGNPNHKDYEGVDDFFEYMLTNYGHLDNFIWEICNEPSETPWTEIKNYADRIVGVIRNINPKALIVVGTPAWSSLGLSGEGGYKPILDSPVIDPVEGQNNIMYSFHFYAGGHDFNYYGNGVKDFASKLPLFVTECGTQFYDGDQENNFEESDRYFNLLEELKISWVNWNFSHDFRSGAVLKKADDYYDLKESGLYIRDRIQRQVKEASNE